MKNKWKILNSVLRSSKKTLGGKFVDGYKTFSVSKEIANEFNNFFANICPSLAASIKYKGKDFDSYLKDRNSYTWFMKPTDEEEIDKVIRNLGNNKRPGHDNISSNIIKKVAKEILYPLKLIFNSSLCSGIVPDETKIAKVVPIYKKELFGNYRPVSVLPCFFQRY